ncbi:hypothetical protein [Schlesneria paludicola]|uniref:hypothetical protein n=1 Tax=Schlesneria paludicola TaxID=360056 RepID=UPI00029AD4C8|nr:hypothetical protein [Schlesneria paludicola]
MQHRVALTIALIAAQLLTAPLSALDRQVIEDRVKRLENLSKSDREQFDRRVAEFEQLSGEERSRVRTLHEALIADRKSNGGLTALLQTYADWLDTLSPIQRDELQREKDTGKRIALIRKLKEEQDHKSKDEDDRPNETAERMDVETLSFIRRKIDQPYGFDIADLTTTMKALVNDLPPEKRLPGFDAPQLTQYTQIINAHAQWKQSYSQWPDDDTLAKIKKAIKQRTAELITHSNAMGESPRETAVRLLLMGIVKQADSSIKISNDEREKALNSMKPDERRKVEKLSVERRNQVLRRRYFESHDDDAYKRCLEVRKSVMDLFQQMDVKLPTMLEKFKKNFEKIPKEKDKQL